MRISKEDFAKVKKIHIYEIWNRLNIPGIPAKYCKSPFRPDSNPSFMITEEGYYWKDFGTGEHGDAVDFVVKALDFTPAAACQLLLSFIADKKVTYNSDLKPHVEVERQKPFLPEMSMGHLPDLLALQVLRGFSIPSMERAIRLGLLRFVEYQDQRCWVVTDGEQYAAQVRRLDGQIFENGAKSLTLRGSWSSWPIGIGNDINGMVFLCEGGPDLLAAVHLANELGIQSGIRFATMLGAGNKIHKNALERFKQSKVLIFNHNDDAGRNGAKIWEEQLQPFAAKIVIANEGFSNVKDLNDLIKIDGHLPVIKTRLMKLLDNK